MVTARIILVVLATEVSKFAVGNVTFIGPGVGVGGVGVGVDVGGVSVGVGVGGGVVGDGVGLGVTSGGVGVGPVPVMVISPLFCPGEKVFKS